MWLFDSRFAVSSDESFARCATKSDIKPQTKCIYLYINTAKLIENRWIVSCELRRVAFSRLQSALKKQCV